MEKQMTLAEAMRLGSTHMTPFAGVFEVNHWREGCALGMMMFAHGKISLTTLMKNYPVLNVIVATVPLKNGMARIETFAYQIAERFNGQVRNGTYNLDEFTEWVATRERELTSQTKAPAADASRVEPTPAEVVA